MGSKIMFIIPYPLNEAPSQRFRFEQYFSLLKDDGHHFEVHSFLDSQNWQFIFKPGRIGGKLMALLIGFMNRFRILFKVRKFDYVFIHREATPIGPPVIEWIISKIIGIKIIYDFDDAIWLTDLEQQPVFLSMLKWRGKVKNISTMAYKISCGNDYLCNFASQFNKSVVYNPTTIDTEHLHNPERFNKLLLRELTIGWTGSHSTIKYLNSIEPILATLQSQYTNLRVLIIADKKPDLSIPFIFKPWDAETEIMDLLQIDIGIMPLSDDAWARGKCGFKALQYMALEKPAVASLVGVNNQIIDHGVTGFLCAKQEDWFKALKTLIDNPDLRIRMGKEGRKKIIENYSVKSNASVFLSLFENL